MSSVDSSAAVCSSASGSHDNGDASSAGATTTKGDEESCSPRTKKIRSQLPDIVVAVGSGDNKKEFECYRVVLSFASDYFDTMLSTSMRENEQGRIEFPDKDAKEWELFYSFIDPATIASRKPTVAAYSDKNDLEVSPKIDESETSKRVRTLLPWFHEFQMNSFLEECEETLCDEIPKEGNWSQQRFWSDSPLCDDVKTKRLACFLDILSLSLQYDLSKCRQKVSDALAIAITYGYRLFDVAVVAKIMPLLDYVDTKDIIWRAFRKFLHSDVAACPTETYAKNDLLKHLVVSGINRQVKNDEIEAVQKKKNDEIWVLEKNLNCAKTSMREMIESFPEKMYGRMPNKKLLRSSKINDAACEVMKCIIYEEMRTDAAKNLNISVPNEYSEARRHFKFD